MTSVVRMVDRLVTAGVALALLVAGGWLIGYRVNLRAARESAERLQPVVLTHTAEWPWWPAAVGGAGVTAVLLGLWLLLLHLRPAGWAATPARRISTGSPMPSPAMWAAPRSTGRQGPHPYRTRQAGHARHR